MRPAAPAALLATVVLALSACAPQHTSPGTPQTTAYAEARRSAGIPDCPTSATPHVPVVGGLPEVALECLGGTSWVRLPDLTGTPTLIIGWAQWCDPCRSESPLLARVLPAYGDRLTVLFVDTSDPKTDLAIEFARDAGITRWPMVVDADWALQSATKTQHLLPVSYLVGADGVIKQRKLGQWKDDAELRDTLRDVLGVSA